MLLQSALYQTRIEMSLCTHNVSTGCLIHGLTNDRPLQVDCVDIQGYTNQQAVEVLRHTGQTVHLKLIRRDFRPEETPPNVAPVDAGPAPSPPAIIPTAVAVMELERRKAAQGWENAAREMLTGTFFVTHHPVKKKLSPDVPMQLSRRFYDS